MGDDIYDIKIRGDITDIMVDNQSNVRGWGDVTDIMGDDQYKGRKHLSGIRRNDIIDIRRANIPDIRGDLSKRPLLPCFEQCVESLSNILW